MSSGAREATVTIDRLAYGGSGFGRIDGKACFVPFTAPGDVVRVALNRETSSYAIAHVLDFVKRSMFRVSPRCAVYSRCGGCHLQHLSYQAQVVAKDEIFAESLWRLARVERDLLDAPLTAEEPWGYRSRIQLKTGSSDGVFHLGFFAPGSHDVIDLPDGCAIAHPAINRALTVLRPVAAEFSQRNLLTQIDLAVGDDGMLVILLHSSGPLSQHGVEYWRNRQQQLSPIAGVFLQQGRVGTVSRVFGEERLTYLLPSFPGDTNVGALRLGFSAGSFSQVNYSQNRAMVRTALDWWKPRGDERVLDLCCGNGNFSLPFARHAGEVIGLETVKRSVADALRNAALLCVTNTRFKVMDGAVGLRRFIAAGERFNLVILDPPRSGAAEMVSLLGEMNADKIMYVSCDPQTLGRDLATLKKGGYRVVRSCVVDMFPQTYHMESITLLERDNDPAK